MRQEIFRDLRPDPHDGVERRHRILEDDGNGSATDFPQRPISEGEQARFLEKDAAANDPPWRRLNQPKDREHADRFAAAALPDDRKALAPVDGIGDAVQGVHNAVDGVELRLEIANLQQLTSRCLPRLPLAAFEGKQSVLDHILAAFLSFDVRATQAPIAPIRPTYVPTSAGQSHLARLLPFSPLSFPRKRESSAPKPVTRPWIPASAGMTATERSESPNAIALLEAVAVDARSFRHGRRLVSTDNRS